MYAEPEFRVRAGSRAIIRWKVISEGAGKDARRAVMNIDRTDPSQGKELDSLDILIMEKGANKRLEKLPEESIMRKKIREAIEKSPFGKDFIPFEGGKDATATATKCITTKSRFGKFPAEGVLKVVHGSVKNTTNKQLGVERKSLSQNPNPTQKQNATRDVLVRTGGTVAGNVISELLKIGIGKLFNGPVISGPSNPEPTEDDLYESFLKQMKELGHKLTYDDIRDEKEAIKVAFKKNLKWYHTDDQTFWKDYPAKGAQDFESWSTAPPEEKFAFELGVLAEHLFLSQSIEEFNSQSKPWIWQLPDDRDELVTELSKRCTDEDGGRAMYDYLATYKYKGKWVLPRFVAIDVASDALYEHLGATDEE
jgi:hypothetical protein